MRTNWNDLVDRTLGHSGLIIIGVMAWTCDRVGYRGPVAASRPPRPAIPQPAGR